MGSRYFLMKQKIMLKGLIFQNDWGEAQLQVESKLVQKPTAFRVCLIHVATLWYFCQLKYNLNP